MSLLGSTPPESFTRFIGDILGTPQGWKLIGLGTAIGFVFAVVALSISVISFPLLLDRHVGLAVAVLTSLRAVRENPVTMAIWGLIVAAVLAIGCPASAPVRHMWTASWQALFFALNGLVGCGHMSGLVARRICPLALMKSDDQDPYQICELQAHVSQQVVFGLRWRPCRSSRFNALAKLQTVICAPAPWICLQEGRRPYAFANISARKISPVLIIAQMIRASLLASATVTRRAEVLKLPKRKQQELATLLDETDLSGIISAAKLVADRLKFLQGLRVILFDHEVKDRLKERSQLHKILESNTWIFGEEFNLWASDRELTTVLNVHKAKLDPDLVIDEPVKLLTRKHGIVDLMLSRAQRRHRANDYEHLVIELKAPKVKLASKALTQIKDYALSVARGPPFPSCEWCPLAFLARVG